MFLIDKLPARIYIGNEGEENATQVQLDVSAWDALYPDAVYSITYVRPGETTVYPEVPSHVVHADGVLTWTPSESVLDISDYGTVVINCTEDDVKKKSVMTMFFVARSHPSSGAAPDPIADWISDATSKLAEVDHFVGDTIEAAEAANAAALRAENGENAREHAEGLRVIAEQGRHDAYVIAEEARDGLYESAEIARDELFESAETTRNTQSGEATDRANAIAGTLEGIAPLWSDVDISVSALGEGAAPTASIAQDETGTSISIGIPKGDTGAQGIQGEKGDGYKPKGQYLSNVQYEYLNVVTDGGSSYAYIHPTPAAGVSVTDTSHWQQIAEKGLKGDQGDQGPKGDPGEVTAAELAAVTSQLAEITGSEQTLVLEYGSTVAEATVDKPAYAPLMLRIDLVFNCVVRAFAVVDDVVGAELPLIDCITGRESYGVASVGVFAVNGYSYTQIKLTRTSSYSNTTIQNARVYILNNYKSQPQAKQLVNASQLPLSYTAQYAALANTSVRVWGIRDGKIVGTLRIADGDVRVVESDENYANFATWQAITEPGFTHPKILEVLDNGSLLFVTYNNKLQLMRSDKTESVLMADFGDNVYAYGGLPQIASYGNIVVINQYRQPASYTNPISVTGGTKIFMSEDYGETFSEIFDLADEYGDDATGCHIHCVAYDPYDDVIWAATGDGLYNQNIFYSLDHGSAWHYADVHNKTAGVQISAITVMPNCVLFQSDATLVCATKINRPIKGTDGFQVDMLEILQEQLNPGGACPTAVRGACDGKGIAVFGYFYSNTAYTQTPSPIFGNCALWATNGNVVRRVFVHTEHVANGVFGVYYDALHDQFVAKAGQAGAIITVKF